MLTAGRLWDDGKGAALLDRIAPRLSAPIRAAGPTSGPGTQAHLPHLALLGALDEPALAAAYAAATVFASPAHYEPFGLAVLEAAQAGMALVLSDIPTFRELWDGVATFVPANDEASWLDALEGALDDPHPTRPRTRPPIHRRRHGGGDGGAARAYGRLMRVVYATHSLESCWNHGNAHFLRGVLRALTVQGHEVLAVEPEECWSRANLVADAGVAALEGWRTHYPDLVSRRVAEGSDPATWLDGADLVIVHEWTAPRHRGPDRGAAPGGGAVPAAVPRHPPPARSANRRRCRRSTCRATMPCWPSARRWPRSIGGWGWEGRVFVWHEAADTFSVPPARRTRPARQAPCGSAIGATASAPPSWSRSFLPPLHCAAIPLDIHGVRYPAEALAMLERYGAPLPRLAAEPRRPGRLRAPRLHRARAPPFLRHPTAGHSHHPGIRGAGLRHTPYLGAVGRCGGAVRAGARTFWWRTTARRSNITRAACLNEPGIHRRPGRPRPGDDPRPA